MQPSDRESVALPYPHGSLSHDKKRGKQKLEPDVNRTRNLLIWSQTRYHCTTDPLSICHSSSNTTRTVNYTQAKYAHAQYSIELWSLLLVFITWSTAIFGKTIFGKAIYGKAISGKAIYGK